MVAYPPPIRQLPIFEPAQFETALDFNGLTKYSVGLGNVDNTSDLDKPISIATQSALDTKLDIVNGIATNLSSNILTVGGLSVLPATYVDITNNQFISGIKYFNSAPTLNFTQSTATSNELISKYYGDTFYQPKTLNPVNSGFVKSTLGTTALSGTYTTIVSFNIPTASIYVVIYTGRVASTTNTGGGTMALFDSTGTIIADTAISIIFSPPPTSESSATGTYKLTTTGAGTYTMRIKQYGGPASCFNDANGFNSVLFYEVAQAGPVGAVGPAGAQGSIGVTPDITIGTTTTLGAGVPATVIKSGTLNTPIFSFGIPQGIQGNIGPQGNIGVTPNITIGNTTTLGTGVPATVVLSGTQLDPIFSFGIPQGIQGVQGNQGIQGNQGNQGAKGDKGDKGDTGAAGDSSIATAAAVSAGISAGAAAASAFSANNAAIAAAGSAFAAETSAASASSSASSSAQSAAQSAQTAAELTPRIVVLEEKTQAQTGNISGSVYTTKFQNKLNITDFFGDSNILINGDSKKISIGNNTTLEDTGGITTPSIITTSMYIQQIDSLDPIYDLNIGTISTKNINIGNSTFPNNSLTINYATSFGKDVNFYGIAQFNENTAFDNENNDFFGPVFFNNGVTVDTDIDFNANNDFSSLGTTNFYGPVNFNNTTTNITFNYDVEFFGLTEFDSNSITNFYGPVLTTDLRITGELITADSLKTGSSTVITTSSSITLPSFEYISLAPTGNITITLPTITNTSGFNNLGTKLTFRRVGGTTSVNISFIGDGSQSVFNNVNFGGTTAQGLMPSGAYIVTLVAMITTGFNYAWYQI